MKAAGSRAGFRDWRGIASRISAWIVHLPDLREIPVPVFLTRDLGKVEGLPAFELGIIVPVAVRSAEFLAHGH